HDLAHHLRDPLRRERLAIARQKEKAIVGLHRKQRPHIIEILLEPERSAFTERKMTILLPLPLPHHHRAVVEIEIPHLQIAELKATDPGRVKKFERRTIANAHR